MLAVFCISVVAFQSVGAAIHCWESMNNAGYRESERLTIHVGKTLNNTGQLVGRKSVKLNCHKLVGDGLIKSPEIRIKAWEFEYTGTIHCDGFCEIITRKPVPEGSFIKSGKGKFTIRVLKKI